MQSTTTQPGSPAVPARLQRYENLAYGLFLHWGLYSVQADGEWYRFHHKIPQEVYGQLMQRFTAEAFDADALVRFAKKSRLSLHLSYDASP
ncbi:MAG: alpha-L-fucosidase [Verrucomicrobia bacterium]|nr:alpha-L-fucosidase [Verrucomicrobiota bacterium]